MPVCLDNGKKVVYCLKQNLAKRDLQILAELVWVSDFQFLAGHGIPFSQALFVQKHFLIFTEERLNILEFVIR